MCIFIFNSVRTDGARKKKKLTNGTSQTVICVHMEIKLESSNFYEELYFSCRSVSDLDGKCCEEIDLVTARHVYWCVEHDHRQQYCAPRSLSWQVTWG